VKPRGARNMAIPCWITLAGVALALAGSSATRIHPLVEERIAAKPRDFEVRLFIRKVEEPFREIAIIDSPPLPSRDEQAREKSLRAIQRAARRLGADAVHDMRPLKLRVRGMVVDERVPFRAYQQGEYELYFWRGTAILYTTPQDSASAAPGAPSGNDPEKEANP